jgi:hypothetical protein
VGAQAAEPPAVGLIWGHANDAISAMLPPSRPRSMVTRGHQCTAEGRPGRCAAAVRPASQDAEPAAHVEHPHCPKYSPPKAHPILDGVVVFTMCGLDPLGPSSQTQAASRRPSCCWASCQVRAATPHPTTRIPITRSWRSTDHAVLCPSQARAAARRWSRPCGGAGRVRSVWVGGGWADLTYPCCPAARALGATASVLRP